MKSLFLLLVLFHLSYAHFQTVSIGTIDKHYKDILTKEQLLLILKDIEYQLESQLGFNVFDYTEDGKPIDIVYMPPSQKKKKIHQHQKKLLSLKKKMNVLNIEVINKKKSIKSFEKKLNTQFSTLNKSIKKLNAYIATQQETAKEMSPEQYKKIRVDVSVKKELLQKNTLNLKKQKKKFNKELSSLKRKVRKYNLLVSRHNKTQRNIERLSKTFKEIKGVTKSNTITTYTSKLEDGATKIEKTISTSMQKIEIYDFENLTLLKVVLAHEIGHLVGVQHINAPNALMNPLVQDNQRQKLELTYDDIQAFYKAFE